MSHQTVMINHPDHASDFYSLIYAPLDWQRQGLQKTATGYGKKIPTVNMIDYAGRKRRIYTDIFSNIGRSYFILKGEEITVC